MFNCFCQSLLVSNDIELLRDVLNSFLSAVVFEISESTIYTIIGSIFQNDVLENELKDYFELGIQ